MKFQANTQEEKGMKSLQKVGGIAALIAAATYLFAMGLAVSVLKPMTDTSLGF